MKIDESVVIDKQKQFNDILPTEVFIWHDEHSMYGKNGKRVLMKILPILEYNAIDLEDGSCYSIPDDADVVAKEVTLCEDGMMELCKNLQDCIKRYHTLEKKQMTSNMVKNLVEAAKICNFGDPKNSMTGGYVREINPDIDSQIAAAKDLERRAKEVVEEINEKKSDDYGANSEPCVVMRSTDSLAAEQEILDKIRENSVKNKNSCC